MATTEKISVTIGREELREAQRHAARLGVSLSSFISGALRERVEAQARSEAARAVLASFDAEDLPSAREQEELLALWGKGREGRVAKARTVRAAHAPSKRAKRAGAGR